MISQLHYCTTTTTTYPMVYIKHTHTKASLFHSFLSFLIWEKGQQPGRCFLFCKRPFTLSFLLTYIYIQRKNALPSLGIVVGRLRHPFVMCVLCSPPSYFISLSLPLSNRVCSYFSLLTQTHSRLPTKHRGQADHRPCCFLHFLAWSCLLDSFYCVCVFFFCCCRGIKYIGGISTPEAEGASRIISRCGENGSMTWPYHSPVRLDFLESSFFLVAPRFS